MGRDGAAEFLRAVVPVVLGSIHASQLQLWRRDGLAGANEPVVEHAAAIVECAAATGRGSSGDADHPKDWWQYDFQQSGGAIRRARERGGRHEAAREPLFSVPPAAATAGLEPGRIKYVAREDWSFRRAERHRRADDDARRGSVRRAKRPARA